MEPGVQQERALSKFHSRLEQMTEQVKRCHNGMFDEMSQEIKAHGISRKTTITPGAAAGQQNKHMQKLNHQAWMP
ncbi:hypothetical protein E2C01_012705 [Portunus trituberculatus]|uniref:Uncharacterized protein n=1 Tax=Portunus trituberculatus TaxID=210409 RepID=A0A5B7DER1_PORTR|nr:hypothetical protein [Portunus trituberculatus]